MKRSPGQSPCLPTTNWTSFLWWLTAEKISGGKKHQLYRVRENKISGMLIDHIGSGPLPRLLENRCDPIMCPLDGCCCLLPATAQLHRLHSQVMGWIIGLSTASDCNDLHKKGTHAYLFMGWKWPIFQGIEGDAEIFLCGKSKYWQLVDGDGKKERIEERVWLSIDRYTLKKRGVGFNSKKKVKFSIQIFFFRIFKSTW